MTNLFGGLILLFFLAYLYFVIWESLLNYILNFIYYSPLFFKDTETANHNKLGQSISIESLNYSFAVLSMTLFGFFVFNSFWEVLKNEPLWLLFIIMFIIICTIFAVMNGRLSYCLKLLKFCANWIFNKNERGYEILSHWSSFSKHWAYLNGNVLAVFLSLVFFVLKISFFSGNELWNIPIFFLDEYLPGWLLYTAGIFWGLFSLLGAIRFKTRYGEIKYVLREDGGYIKEEMGVFVGKEFQL